MVGSIDLVSSTDVGVGKIVVDEMRKRIDEVGARTEKILKFLRALVPAWQVGLRGRCGLCQLAKHPTKAIHCLFSNHVAYSA